jgi:hypothetical protein
MTKGLTKCQLKYLLVYTAATITVLITSCTKFCGNVPKERISHNILRILFIKKIQDQVCTS